MMKLETQVIFFSTDKNYAQKVFKNMNKIINVTKAYLSNCSHD